MRSFLLLLTLLLLPDIALADGPCYLTSSITACFKPVGAGSGGTGVVGTATFPTSGVVVTEAATETLTNKTLTAPKINHIVAPGIWNIDFAAVNTDWTFPSSTNDPETLVGATSTQTIQHKTLDSTNTAFLDDTLFTIVDHIDNTKAIAWDSAGSTSTATTLKAAQTANRTITFPDATDTLVGQTRSISTTAPITGGGDLSANRTIAITQAATAANGYLSSTDWNTFNGRALSTRSIATTAPLAGGGDLSADRTLSIPVAATAANGYLSSTDWNTFNSKQPTVSVTAPVTFTSNTVAIPKATTSVDGYLSSTDWTTFNNGGAGSTPNTRLINTTAPITGGGNLTADRTIAIPVATTSANGYLSSTDWTTFANESSGNITTGLVFLGGGFSSTTFTTGRYFQRNKWVNIIVQASGTRNGGGGTANIGTLTLPFTSARSFNALFIHGDSVIATTVVACAQFVASSATVTFFTGMDCTGGAGNNTAIHTYNIDLWYEST